MSDAAQTIITALVTGLAAVITSAVSFGIFKFNQWLKTKTKNVQLQQLIDSTLGIAEDVVIMINQTYVDDLKDKDMFNKEAQQKAFNKAFLQAKSMISEKGEKLLTEEFGNVDIWLTAIIESKVVEVKEHLKVEK